MRHALAVILFFVVGSAQAATVTIDFEEFSGSTSGPLVSQGFVFSGEYTDGQLGPLDLINGGAAFGAVDDLVVMEHAGGQNFQLYSLDMGYIVTELPCSVCPLFWTGTVRLTGFYASGGSIHEEFAIPSPSSISAVLGAEWTGLERVEVGVVSFGCPGDNCPFSFSVSPIDNIVVNAVPIPAAVWLFGSALGFLGWMRRRRNA